MKDIDTHTLVKDLTAVGFSKTQAEILVDTFMASGLSQLGAIGWGIIIVSIAWAIIHTVIYFWTK